jgi:hypothetical protein
MIIINYVQNLGLIGSIRLEWPEILQRCFRVFNFDWLPCAFPLPACYLCPCRPAAACYLYVHAVAVA